MKDKKEIIKLNKIVGQVKGLIKLIEMESDCEKIIIQFQAVKGALDGVFNDILHKNLQRCLRSNRSKELNVILKQVIKK